MMTLNLTSHKPYKKISEHFLMEMTISATHMTCFQTHNTLTLKQIENLMSLLYRTLIFHTMLHTVHSSLSIFRTLHVVNFF